MLFSKILQSHPPVHKPLLPGLIFVIGWLASGSIASAQPAPLVVLTEASLADGVSYDAWVEFKDKGNPSPEQRREIRAALEKEFHPRALARRKAQRSLPGVFDERDEPLVGLHGVHRPGDVAHPRQGPGRG